MVVSKPYIIADEVYEFIDLHPMQKELMDLPELQRLKYVRQLGLAYHVYPGATHSRFSHALGTSHIASETGEKLGFSDDEVLTLMAAGLLHDIAHTPFSHAIEPLLEMNHMYIIPDIILGKFVMPIPGAGRIPEILQKYGVNPVVVSELITKTHTAKPYLQQVIFGEIDGDTIDFLHRDSNNTGSLFGKIEYKRIRAGMRIIDGVICYRDNAIDAIENFLEARAHSYSAIYYHRITAVFEAMLTRAVSLVKDRLPNFQFYRDDQLLTKLEDFKESQELTRKILSRERFVTAYSINRSEANSKKELLQKLLEIGESNFEKKIIEITCLGPSELIVKFHIKRVEQSEPRFKELNIRIIPREHKNKENLTLADTKELFEISEKAKQFSKCSPVPELICVYCDKGHKEKVQEAVDSVIRDIYN